MARGRGRPRHAARRHGRRRRDSSTSAASPSRSSRCPGTRPGISASLHRESGTAIVMDAVLERGLYTTDDELISPPPYASVPAYRGTIDRLRELRPARLGTSHYAPIEGDAAVTAFLDATAGFVDDLDAARRRRARSRAAAARALLASRRRRARAVQRDGGRARPIGRRAPRPRGRGGARRHARRRAAARRSGQRPEAQVPHRGT